MPEELIGRDGEIIIAVARERRYQDDKWGTIEEKPHDVGAWLTIMRCELREAEEAWMKGTDAHALSEILQIVAVGVACMEQHGVVGRNDFTVCEDDEEF